MAGYFLAVGTSGGSSAFTTSTDGVNWSSATNFPVGITATDVAWSPDLGLWVVAGLTGGLATSPDGVTWTVRTSGTASTLSAVTWADTLGLFVAVGNSGVLLTSPDGITWTSRTSGFGATNIANVAWSPDVGVLVACGLSSKVSYSTDGITWTNITVGALGRTHNAVEWADTLGLFVMSGDRQIFTSPDGVTWTSRSYTIIGSSEVRNSGKAVAWSSDLGIYLIGSGTAGADVTSRYDTSPDAVTWTKRNMPSGAGVLDDFAWSADLGLFVAVQGTSYFYSSSGTSWTLATGSGPLAAAAAAWGGVPLTAGMGFVLGFVTFGS